MDDALHLFITLGAFYVFGHLVYWLVETAYWSWSDWKHKNDDR